MANEKNRKVTFETVIACPHCNKNITIRNERTLTNEPVKAEYDEDVVVEKNLQKGLGDYKNDTD